MKESSQRTRDHLHAAKSALEQIKAIHAQTDPQVKAILNPQQYEQLQQVRQQEIHQVMEMKMGQQ